MKHRILLVDDHEVVRKGIASLLSTRWEVCGEARDGAEAIEQVRQLKPELVILDLRMPRMSGTIAAKAIRRAAPNVKIMLLSVHDSETLETLTPLVGADAWLSKSCSTETLHKTIAAVLKENHRH